MGRRGCSLALECRRPQETSTNSAILPETRTVDERSINPVSLNFQGVVPIVHSLMLGKQDFTSFLYAIAACLSDRSKEVSDCAIETLAELAKSNPIPVCRTLVAELTTIRSGVDINRTAVIAAVTRVVQENFRLALIEIIVPPLFTTVTAVPPSPSDLIQIALDVISTCADQDATAVAAQLSGVSSLIVPVLEFLAKRSARREAIFFVRDGAPTALFRSLWEAVGTLKIVPEPVRRLICAILSDLAPLMLEVSSQGSSLSPYFERGIEWFSKTWWRSSPPDLQSKYLRVVGRLCTVVAQTVLGPMMERICIFFTDYISKAVLKHAAAFGLAVVLSLVNDFPAAPKIRHPQITSKLYDFIDDELMGSKNNEVVKEAVDAAVQGLAFLMKSYPPGPLDLLFKKMPAPAALYTLSQFCVVFAESELRLRINQGMAVTRFMTFNPEQKELYAGCLIRLLERGAVAADQFAAIFRNVIGFVVSSSPEAQRTSAALVELVQEKDFVFPYLSPTIFQFLLSPQFLNAVPTLASLGATLGPHVSRVKGQLQNASIDLSSLIAILLILRFVEIYKPDTKTKLALIATTILEIEPQPEETLVAAVCAFKGEQGFGGKILAATRGLIDKYINFGGEKPLLLLNDRGLLKAAVAVLHGYLVQTEEVSKDFETIQADVLSRFDPAKSLPTEGEGIAKYFGLVGKTKPETVMQFLQQEAETLITNFENRFKLWKKKGKTYLNLPSMFIAVSYFFDYAPVAYNASALYPPCNGALFKDKDLSDRIRLQFMKSSLARASKVSTFQVPDAPQMVKYAVSKLRGQQNLLEYHEAVSVLVAAFKGTAALISEPDKILDHALSIIGPQLSGSEIIRIIGDLSELLAVIISQSHRVTPDLFLTFHQCFLRYIQLPRFTMPILEALRRILDAYETLNEPSETLLLQVAALYVVVALIDDYAEPAKTVVRDLFKLIKPGDYSLATPIASAQALFNFEVPDIYSAMINTPLVFSQRPEPFGSAAEKLFVSFTGTRQAREKLPEIVHHYLGATMNCDAAMQKLLSIDCSEVIRQLVTEPFGPVLVSVVSHILASPDFKNESLKHLLYCDEAVIENALNLMKESVVPFEGNSEEIYVRLTILHLKLREPNLTNTICDILCQHLAHSDTFGPDSTARVQILDFENTAGLRMVFDNLVSRPGTDFQKLVDLVASVSERDADSGVIAAVACGSILPHVKTPELMRAIIDILTKHAEPGRVADERFRAIGNMAQAPPDIRSNENIRVMTFLIERGGTNPIGLVSLVRIVSAAGDEHVFQVNQELFPLLLKLCQQPDSQLVLPALMIATVMAKSGRLTTPHATDSFLELFPLVIATVFAYDKETSRQAITALCKRLVIPAFLITNQVVDFVDANVQILVRSLKDVPTFVSQIEKVRAHEDERVRAGVVYLTASLIRYGGGVLIDRRAELLEEVIVCMKDESELVRRVSTNAFGILYI
jgi:hypothetical protein